MLIRIARGSMANRLGAVGLTVFTIAISIALLVLVEQMRGQVRDGFQRSVSGVDLIVGAPTAPVQLLLFTVFGLGDPTANVSWETFEALAEAETVDWAVPISLGDSYRGDRVVGTTPGFFEHFRYAGGEPLRFAQGSAWTARYDVVLGTRVARGAGLAIGDEIALGHGGGNVSLVTHDAHPFTVRGILAPTGTPIDRQLYVPLEAHEALHRSDAPPGFGPGRSVPRHDKDTGDREHGQEHGSPAQVDHAHDDDRPHGHDHDHEHDLDHEQDHGPALEPDEVTAIFLGLTARAAAFGLQRRINAYPDEALLAILPGIALQQLWRITGTVEQVLRVVAGLVVVAGLLGMLTALLTTLNERRREMAILRACGARPWQVAGLLVLEAAGMVLAGLVLGVLFAYGLQVLLAPWLLVRFGIAIEAAWPTMELLGLLGLIGLAGVLVALVPAVMVYRRTLADGMQVRQ